MLHRQHHPSGNKQMQTMMGYFFNLPNKYVCMCVCVCVCACVCVCWVVCTGKWDETARIERGEVGIVVQTH